MYLINIGAAIGVSVLFLWIASKINQSRASSSSYVIFTRWTVFWKWHEFVGTFREPSSPVFRISNENRLKREMDRESRVRENLASVRKIMESFGVSAKTLVHGGFVDSGEFGNPLGHDLTLRSHLDRESFVDYRHDYIRGMAQTRFPFYLPPPHFPPSSSRNCFLFSFTFSLSLHLTVLHPSFSFTLLFPISLFIFISFLPFPSALLHRAGSQRS